MAKRFGRNQRRKLREQVKAAELKVDRSRREANSIVSNHMAQRRNSITLDVDFFPHMERRTLEVRAEMTNPEGSRIACAQELRHLEAAQVHSQENLVRQIGEHVARSLTTYLAQNGWR